MFLRDLREQAALATGNFARLFGKMEVPPLPQVAVRLLELSRDEEVAIADMAKVIGSDAGLASKILRTVNSAHSALLVRVTDVHHGVALLGIRRIRSLALAYSAASALPRAARGFEPERFWQDSLQRAAFARALASQIARGAEGEAFTGALLQNMALPILLNQWGKHYLPVMTDAQTSGKDLVEVENAHLAWNHAQAGAWMARNWGLPDLLVCCIGLHHATLEELASVNLSATPAAAVAVSSRLPDAGPIVRDGLGVEDETYRCVCETTDEACAELADLFGVPAPRPLLNSG